MANERADIGSVFAHLKWERGKKRIQKKKKDPEAATYSPLSRIRSQSKTEPKYSKKKLKDYIQNIARIKKILAAKKASRVSAESQLSQALSQVKKKK